MTGEVWMGDVPKWAEDRSRWVVIEVVSGVGGLCLAIQDRRVAGPKPYGGGKVIHRWIIGADDLKNVLFDASIEGPKDR